MTLLSANEAFSYLHAFLVLFIYVQEPDLLELCLYLLCGVFCFSLLFFIFRLTYSSFHTAC